MKMQLFVLMLFVCGCNGPTQQRPSNIVRQSAKCNEYSDVAEIFFRNASDTIVISLEEGDSISYPKAKLKSLAKFFLGLFDDHPKNPDVLYIKTDIPPGPLRQRTRLALKGEYIVKSIELTFFLLTSHVRKNTPSHSTSILDLAAPRDLWALFAYF